MLQGYRLRASGELPIGESRYEIGRAAKMFECASAGGRRNLWAYHFTVRPRHHAASSMRASWTGRCVCGLDCPGRHNFAHDQ